ncbi:MAG TPA: hypothetical protein VFC78_15690 [Tepidisphaeraceae bacterium]|nr:hypothetical protein [Tepidisphaeraceae bacterium]
MSSQASSAGSGKPKSLVEDMLTENGGHYQKGKDWASFVVTDGKLVTGQNPASSQAAARKLLTLL